MKKEQKRRADYAAIYVAELRRRQHPLPSQQYDPATREMIAICA